jgi:hypothetical protein
MAWAKEENPNPVDEVNQLTARAKAKEFQMDPVLSSYSSPPMLRHR